MKMDKVGNHKCIHCKFPYCNSSHKACENCGEMPLSKHTMLVIAEGKRIVSLLQNGEIAAGVHLAATRGKTQ